MVNHHYEFKAPFLFGVVFVVNNHINIVNFICANGCEELLEGLRTQEINLRHISRL